MARRAWRVREGQPWQGARHAGRTNQRRRQARRRTVVAPRTRVAAALADGGLEGAGWALCEVAASARVARAARWARQDLEMGTEAAGRTRYKVKDGARDRKVLLIG